jgi:curved DNA-binding protein CbpA
MNTLQNSLEAHDDPAEILGVSIDASPEQIRAAYLRKVREYPPERFPAEFEKIRDAYDILKDPRKRILTIFAKADPNAPLVSLLAGESAERRFAGPEVWLAAMKEK